MPLLVPDKVNMNYANMIEEASLKVSRQIVWSGLRGEESVRLEVANHARKLSL